MSSSRLSLLQLTTLITLLAHISTAASPPVASPISSPSPSLTVPDYMAPGPSLADEGTDCMTLMLGAADCLTYVVEGSNLTAPDKACCPELEKLVRTNPICLCQMLNKVNSFEFTIDMARALTLPAACHVVTPDPTLCALVNGSPAGAPGSSPTGSVLPLTSANNVKGDAAVVACSTTSIIVALVAFIAFNWNMF